MALISMQIVEKHFFIANVDSNALSNSSFYTLVAFHGYLEKCALDV